MQGMQRGIRLYRVVLYFTLTLEFLNSLNLHNEVTCCTSPDITVGFNLVTTTTSLWLHLFAMDLPVALNRTKLGLGTNLEKKSLKFGDVGVLTRYNMTSQHSSISGQSGTGRFISCMRG